MSILDDLMGEYGFAVPKAAYDKLQEHIATRQPVGDQDGDSYQRGYNEGYSEGYQQQITDSSVAVAWRGFCSDGVEFETCKSHCEENPDYWQPLYANPPAQAVDLKQFRASVQAHRDGFAANRRMTEYARDPVPERKKRDLQGFDAQIAECDRLLALIDGKAVK